MLNRTIETIKHLRMVEWVCFAVFSLLLALSVVLSNHIQMTGDAYEGLASENYISPYGIADIGVFAAVFAVTLICCTLLYIGIGKATASKAAGDDKPLAFKPIALSAFIMLLFHIPYLLAYYPGFIFDDSLHSIRQSLGLEAYANHFPVAYTMLIKICIKIAYALGLSTTTGCALYSIIQTAVVCTCYSVMIQWVMQRTGAKARWRVILVAAFSLIPYIATYSIAMWKDPMFNAAIVVATVLTFDFVRTSGRIAVQSKGWLPVFALCSLAIAFLRSNGLLIDLGIFAVLALYVMRGKERLRGKRPWLAASIPAAAIALNLVITGPVYTALGVIPTEKAEGYGLPLNQMARVVVMNGEMSDSDRDYMNQLLPLEKYESVYSPTCIDPLKWDLEFNNAALENGFAGHWMSMLLKNPGIYFEAWEMQTFGYWTINHPSVLAHDYNIRGGSLQALDDSGRATLYGITPRNYFGGNARHFLVYDCPSIPIGWVAWSVAFLAIALALQGRKRFIIPLVPCFMLVASLLVASPIWYWERYGAALQLLVPFLIALPFAIPGSKHPSERVQAKKQQQAKPSPSPTLP